MAKTVRKVATLALACCGYTLIGCSSGQGAGTPPVGSEESTGALGFALQLATGQTINTASYSISGPNGFSKSGSIDVSNSSTLSATIGGLPTGTGYQITITATTTD